MPPEMPDASEQKWVMGTKEITIPAKKFRVPVETGKGNVLINKGAQKKNINFKAPKQYMNPEVMAKNEISKIPEGSALAKVQQQLYAAGFYDSTDVIPSGYRTPDDYAAMKRAMEAANARGVMWQDEAANRIYLASTGATAVTPGATGSGTASGKGSGGTTKSLNITGPKSARSTFDVMNLKYTSRKASDQDFSSFYDALVKAQQAAPIKYEKKKIGGSWYTVQTSDGVNAEEFAETWVFNKINFADENLGGAAGQNLTAVGELAKMYDVNLSLAQRAELAKALTTGSGTDNDIRKTLAEKAKLKYKALANDITETVTVQDLLAEQLSAYANTLELGIKDVKVSDIEPYAFKDGQLLNTSETIQNIKNNNAAYRSTGGAKQEAATFALGLARSIGYGV
jgi:hypothetical protein